jgi:hypothetical protein
LLVVVVVVWGGGFGGCDRDDDGWMEVGMEMVMGGWREWVYCGWVALSGVFLAALMWLIEDGFGGYDG